ncbi:hypothetical protein SCG7109_AY_00020 [Chlamydiales bacterium SCGC AG-110-M15]|nr:hypothetical protein SCG7109_AY_00020 [Chlamydiales bacterium SCGC AG-110-M15]
MNRLEKIYSKCGLFAHIVLRLFLNAGETLRDRSKTALKDPEKILVVATLRLGDLLMTLPLYEALRKRYPKAHISVLTHPAFDPVFANVKNINQCIPYYGKGKALLRLLRKMRRYKFDLCINVCEGHLNSLVYASGIPRRIGFQQKRATRDRFYLTDALKHSGEFKGISHFFLKLLEPLDIKTASAQPKLPRPSLKYPFPKGSAKYRIAIHAGTKEEMKIWPYYSELINRLVHDFDSVQVILTGSKNEVHPVIGNHEQVLDLIGKTTLTELMQLYASVELVIGNDTGPLHIARALGTPSITLFGPVSESILGTIDKDKHACLSKKVSCRPNNATLFGIPIEGLQRCRLSSCSHHTCMRSLTVEEVLKRVSSFLLT